MSKVAPRGPAFAVAARMTCSQAHARTLLFVSLTLGGCGASDATAPTEGDPGTQHDSFSTAPGEPNHEAITATALSFLRPEALTALQVANVATDVEFFLVNANHFDDCNFTGGADVVRNSQAEAVAALDPSVTTVETDLLAMRAFGRSLHALQDFYAHTNWIELGGDVLVDSSRAAFPSLLPYSTIPSSGFVVVQGNKPKRAALKRDESAPYPTLAVVQVKLDRTWRPGLISGGVDYEAGDFCPAPVALSHDELNKDKSTNAGRVQQYEAAKSLAILQTEHEWCRLRALTRATWGDAGVARLDAWIAPDAIAPTCE
jgi:hypothetical protein